MSKVILDEALRSKLNGLNEQLELCDEAGRTLGHFLPIGHYLKMMYPQDQCPYSAEELTRRFQEKGGRPLAELWKELGVR